MNFSRSLVNEIEFVECLERELTIDPCVERHFQDSTIPAMIDGGLEQRGSDSSSLMVLIDAQAADFALLGFEFLNADHADDTPHRHRHPEAGTIPHVRALNIIEIGAGIIVGNRPAE